MNRLLEARKQMEKLMKGMGKGKMPDLGSLAARRGRASGGRVSSTAQGNEVQQEEEAKQVAEVKWQFG